MRICIILPCNIYSAPFYYKYVDILKMHNKNFDLIYWNRTSIEEVTYAENNYIFFQQDKVNSGSYIKVLKYISFYRYVKKHLKRKKYDRIIILGSYAGIMALMASFLLKNYKGKYLLDIRDYTFENFKIYFNKIKLAIVNSHTTVISSEGYKEFLPKWDYVISHNLDIGNIEKIKSSRNHYYQSQDEIRISFIGLVRYFEENIKLINAMKNNKNFKMQYYGMNSEKLQHFCEMNNVKNTDFYGRFEPRETPLFYNKTDLINNVYGENGIQLTTALSNKLYFAASLEIPILVSKGTLMEKISCGYNFGYAVDFSDNNLVNSIHEWYRNIDEKSMRAGCKKFMARVLQDEEIFKHSLSEFLSEEFKWEES